MKFTKEEIRKSMLLYAVTDRAWLKENESLVSVCKEVLENGATFLQIREKDLDAALLYVPAATDAVMVTVPAFLGVTTPLLLTVAVSLSDEE